MAINWRIWTRKSHRWGAILIALPFLLVIGTGILLQLKKEWSWVQPPTLRGQGKTPTISLEAILAAARSRPEVGVQGWDDVDRLDIQPSRGIAKVLARSRWEAQVDLNTGEILQVAYRRSDLIESLHDGSWFHDRAKLWVFLPVAAVVLGLWVTGIYLFFLPYTVRWSRGRKVNVRRRPKQEKECLAVHDYIGLLTDEPAKTPQDVFQRCQAAEALAKLGPSAHAAMPALLRTLVVRVSVDCVLALRVAAAEALWKVGARHDLALPFLAWGLKDEYWGASRKAAQALGEIGSLAHYAIPDLVRLAERRCAHGRFRFEEFHQTAGDPSEPCSLLAIVATALGNCGRCDVHWQEAHAMLTRLTGCEEEDARTAAVRALAVLGDAPASLLRKSKTPGR